MPDVGVSAYQRAACVPIFGEKHNVAKKYHECRIATQGFYFLVQGFFLLLHVLVFVGFFGLVLWGKDSILIAVLGLVCFVTLPKF